MTNTTWKFTKDGHTYSANGNNRFDAQLNIETRFGIDLTGAAFEEIYKTLTVRTGKVN